MKVAKVPEGYRCTIYDKIFSMVRLYGHTYRAREWINRVRLATLHAVSLAGKINIPLSAFAPENLASRDGFGSPVPRQPAHLHTQAEHGAYLRDSYRVPRWRPFIYIKPSYAIGSVPSLSGHAIAYRWRSLPRVRRHRASEPQGSSKRVLPQVPHDKMSLKSWILLQSLEVSADCLYFNLVHRFRSTVRGTYYR